MIFFTFLAAVATVAAVFLVGRWFIKWQTVRYKLQMAEYRAERERVDQTLADLKRAFKGKPPWVLPVLLLIILPVLLFLQLIPYIVIGVGFWKVGHGQSVGVAYVLIGLGLWAVKKRMDAKYKRFKKSQTKGDDDT